MPALEPEEEPECERAALQGLIVNFGQLSINQGSGSASSASGSAPAAAVAPAPAQDGAAPRSRGERAPEPAPAENRGEAWCYVVWVLPDHPEATGIHCGGGAAWRALLELLPGRSYSYRSGTRLRRADNLDAAKKLYAAERDRHSCPREARIHVH